MLFCSRINANFMNSLYPLSCSFLFNNKLMNLPSEAFTRLPSLKRLRLDGNPIHCNCAVHSLWQYYQQHPQHKLLNIALNCETPAQLSHRNFNNLKDEDFHCSEYPLSFAHSPTHFAEPWAAAVCVNGDGDTLSSCLRVHWFDTDDGIHIWELYHEYDKFYSTLYLLYKIWW